MIDEIVASIIHFLGGVTSEERFDDVERAHRRGEKDMARQLLKYAQSLYGADNWGKKLYNQIEEAAICL